MFQKNETDQVTEKSSRSELLKSSLQRKKGFHLRSDNDESNQNKRPYLLKYDFKQRIDSMFDETRSAILESVNCERNQRVFRAVRSECGAEPVIFESHNRPNIFQKRSAAEFRDERKIKNLVQARIEKMFADVSSSEVDDEPSAPTVHRFQVDHIGSLPLFNKITSLEGLQEPLKNLYFNYRKNKFPSSKLQALLEISQLGLKVQNFGHNHSDVKEQLNQFPSIAVWAALKFVCRQQESPNRLHGNSGLEYAFLPIVLDQKNTEKSSLFRPLDQKDISCAMEKTYDDHSPLFVVIMRQNGTSNNRLLCHGFACATSEDAIVLAANLYKALVAAMTRSHRIDNTDEGSLKRRKKVKCRNGLGTVCSIAGSSICGEAESDYLPSEKRGEDIITRNTEKPRIPKKLAPPRPQRKPKQTEEMKNIADNESSKISLASDEIITVDDVSSNKETENLSNKKADQRPSDEKIVKNEEFQQYESKQDRRNRNASVCSRRSTSSDRIECGDILTKVVIPRSGSFLNASGPLTSRYGRFVSDRGTGITSNHRKNSIHSPLGFIELFNELRIHEGLNNIDEILNTIIDVDGMSFNSLKPIYKEFIFKLAVTLTKDELYQRSKTIMQKQKRRKRQLAMNRRRRTFVSGYKIKRAFHISVSKLKSTSKCKISLPFSSHIFPALKKMQQNKPHYKTKIKLRRCLNDPASTLTSKDSFESLLFRGKDNSNSTSVGIDLTSDNFYKGEILFHRKKLLTGTCTRVQNMTMTFHPVDLLKRSSSSQDVLNRTLDRKPTEKSRCRHNTEEISGYVSCSECSYNSESCKYKSFRKCYCSMQKQHSRLARDRRDGDDTLEEMKLSSVSSCSCDTESCVESEKCYCNPSKKPSIFEQLRRQGFAASESSLSRPTSPVSPRKTDENPGQNERKGKTCLQASKSLEFYHVQKNVSQFQLNYGDNKAGHTKSKRKPPPPPKPPNVKQPLLADKNSNLKTDLTPNNGLASSIEGDTTSEFEIDRDNNNTDEDPFVNSESSFNYNYFDNYKRQDDNDDNYYGKSKDPVANGNFQEDHHRDAREQNKILVVSTRDQKGHVKNSFTPLYNRSLFNGSKYPFKYFKNENIQETDAISIKKSAEIAALFSDMKVQKKNHINIRCSRDIIYNSLEPGDGFLRNRAGNRPMPIKNINLENSLGYFP